MHHSYFDKIAVVPHSSLFTLRRRSLRQAHFGRLSASQCIAVLASLAHRSASLSTFSLPLNFLNPLTPLMLKKTWSKRLVLSGAEVSERVSQHYNKLNH